MGGVLGELLPLAVTVAISPIPIIAVILMLLTPNAGGASAGLLIGWVAGIFLATTVFLLIASGMGLTGASDDPSPVVSWIKLLLGVLLVVLAARQWKARPKPGEHAELPGWMKAIDRITPVKAAGLGVLLSAVNPKNLMMCVAAGVTLAGGDLSGGGSALLVVVFTLLAASSVLIPVLGYALAADRMRTPLATLKTWLEQNNATVMFVLLLVMGVVMIGKGLGGLL